MAGVTVEAVLALLPQTQCRRCGYDDCRGYAEAIAGAGADVNRCPPGGAEGVERLARLTARPALPVDPDCGVESPRGVATVDEAWCIGCALCLKACPVDAIVGAAKRMHVVIDELCTGCELCVPVCPVDCISMHGVTGDRTGWSAWDAALADRARQRHADHVEREGATIDTRAGQGALAAPRRETVAAVLARAREARAAR